jgi:hypothetical protein
VLAKKVDIILSLRSKLVEFQQRYVACGVWRVMCDV